MTKLHSITNWKQTNKPFEKKSSPPRIEKGPSAIQKKRFSFQMNAAIHGLYINAAGTRDDSNITNVWERKQIGIIK